MNRDPAVPLECQGPGGHPFNEVPIMADKQDREIAFGEQVPQKVQRLHVQVVRGFVQHQEVCGPCHDARKQKARPFAA